MKLSEAEAPIRAALQRLAESPRELRCFVIIEDRNITGRFVQFCTPPPPAKLAGSPRICCDDNKPLIFDGYGNGKPDGYRSIGECCNVETAVRSALNNLNTFLPVRAELRIIEESTQMERPS